MTVLVVLFALFQYSWLTDSSMMLNGTNETMDLDALQQLMDGFILFEDEDSMNETWTDLASNRYRINQGRSPYFISIPFNEDDISLTWQFIQLYDYEWSVFSAEKSHAWIGDWSVCDDCIVISLSAMNEWTLSNDSSLFTVEPSIEHQTWTAILSEYGVVIPPANCKNCVFGGWIQGGGFGFITQRFGLASDYIESARIMLYDGTFIEATKTNQYADLLWGIRGGGATIFGIVSQYKLNTINIIQDYPDYRQVTRYQIWYRYNTSTAASIFNIWSEYNSANVTIFLYFFPQFNADNPSESYFKIRLTALFLGTGDAADMFLDDVLSETPEPLAVNVWNETLWDGLIANMAPGFDRDRPASSRYMTLNKRPSESDITYIIQQIDRSHELFALNLTSTWIFYCRSRPSNDYSAFPWNQYETAYEIAFAPGWGSFDSVENRLIAKQWGNEMVAQFEDDKSWYHTYTNTPDTDQAVAMTEKDWRYQYYGYMSDEEDDRYYSDEQNLILKQLSCLKQKYDPMNVFQTTFPVDPNDCNVTVNVEMTTSDVPIIDMTTVSGDDVTEVTPDDTADNAVCKGNLFVVLFVISSFFVL